MTSDLINELIIINRFIIFYSTLYDGNVPEDFSSIIIENLQKFESKMESITNEHDLQFLKFYVHVQKIYIKLLDTILNKISDKSRIKQLAAMLEKQKNKMEKLLTINKKSLINTNYNNYIDENEYTILLSALSE